MYSRAKWKRSDLAIASIEIARSRLPELNAVALGTKLPRDLPSWIERCEQPNKPDLNKAYATCLAWLFSSDIEGFGLPILEAMACGTPVIGTPAGAAPKLVTSETGVLVPFDDLRNERCDCQIVQSA